MVYALSALGFTEYAKQLLLGLTRWQRRDGSFVSQSSEWDSTGQALWVMAQHLALHPDAQLLAELRPAIEQGARWLAYS